MEAAHRRATENLLVKERIPALEEAMNAQVYLPYVGLHRLAFCASKVARQPLRYLALIMFGSSSSRKNKTLKLEQDIPCFTHDFAPCPLIEEFIEWCLLMYFAIRGGALSLFLFVCLFTCLYVQVVPCASFSCPCRRLDSCRSAFPYRLHQDVRLGGVEGPSDLASQILSGFQEDNSTKVRRNTASIGPH